MKPTWSEVVRALRHKRVISEFETVLVAQVQGGAVSSLAMRVTSVRRPTEQPS